MSNQTRFWDSPLTYLFAGDILRDGRERALTTQAEIDRVAARQIAEGTMPQRTLDAYMRAGGNPYNPGNGMVEVFRAQDAQLETEARQILTEETQAVAGRVRRFGDGVIGGILSAVPIWVWVGLGVFLVVKLAPYVLKKS
jgi:hypothetical protein